MTTFDIENPTARIFMTPNQRLFLADYLLWVNAGAPRSPIFGRGIGLCFTAVTWADRYDVSHLHFHELFGSYTYPFGVENYEARFFNETQHRDPLRLAFVRNNI